MHVEIESSFLALQTAFWECPGPLGCFTWSFSADGIRQHGQEAIMVLTKNRKLNIYNSISGKHQPANEDHIKRQNAPEQLLRQLLNGPNGQVVLISLAIIHKPKRPCQTCSPCHNFMYSGTLVYREVPNLPYLLKPSLLTVTARPTGGVPTKVPPQKSAPQTAFFNNP